MCHVRVALFALLIALPLAAQEAEDEQAYRFAAGDEFSVQVYGEEDLTRELVVAPDGYIYYPFVGRVKVSGLTVEEVNGVILKELGKQLRRPRIALTLKKVNHRQPTGRLFVFGRVATPGSYPVTKNMRVIEALNLAGGLAEGASPSTARIMRQGKLAAEIDLKKLLIEGDLTQNLPVQEDDVLLVPSVDVLQVLVVGAVNHPGVQPWREGVRLLDVIGGAGGIVEQAAPERTSVIRDGQKLRADLRMLLEQGSVEQNLEIEAGDVVVVPVATSEEREVTVVGEVKTPGVFALGDDTRLLEALTLAGGPTETADLTAVQITRDGKALTANLKALLTEGQTGQNLLVQTGDIVLVPKRDRHVLVVGEVQAPGLYEISDDARLLNALALAQGIRATGDVQQVRVIRPDAIVTANVNALLKEGDMSQNVPLKPGDTVLVSQLDTIQVVGEVRRPGVQALKDEYRLSDALTNAGWPTENASLTNVAILRVMDSKPLVIQANAESLMHQSDMSQNAVLKSGDVVVVPGKKVRKKLSLTDITSYLYILDRVFKF